MFSKPRKAASSLTHKVFSYRYNGEVIEYGLWLNSGDVPIKSILFLGTVQIGKLPVWIARKCPVGTLVVQGAPHWLAKADGSDTREFVIRFTEEVCDRIFLEYKTIDKVSFMADSQAVSAVLYVLARALYLNKINSLVLIQPFGLTANIYKKSQSSGNMELFKKRVDRNLVHQLPALLSDRKLIYNHLKIWGKSFSNQAKSDAQYGSGLIHDAADDLLILANKNIPMAIISGGKDEIFPPKEIQASLDSYQINIPIIVIKNIPHSPLATRHGTKLLNKSFECI